MVSTEKLLKKTTQWRLFGVRLGLGKSLSAIVLRVSSSYWLGSLQREAMLKSDWCELLDAKDS
jgi:hypothetical protein